MSNLEELSLRKNMCNFNSLYPISVEQKFTPGLSTILVELTFPLNVPVIGELLYCYPFSADYKKSTRWKKKTYGPNQLDFKLATLVEHKFQPGGKKVFRANQFMLMFGVLMSVELLEHVIIPERYSQT